MSLTTPQRPPRKGNDAGGDEVGIMSSIKALKSVLMIDSPSQRLLSANKPSIAMQQSRYQERRTYEEQIEQLQTTVADLEGRLKASKEEAEKESSVRKTLETTYEALSKHKKELSVQLELVSKSRSSLEEKLETLSKKASEEKASFAQQRREWEPQVAILKEKNEEISKTSEEWEARCLSSQREVEELKSQVESLKTQMQESEARHQESSQQHAQAEEALKHRLEETEVAKSKSDQEVSTSCLWF